MKIFINTPTDIEGEKGKKYPDFPIPYAKSDVDYSKDLESQIKIIHLDPLNSPLTQWISQINKIQLHSFHKVNQIFHAQNKASEIKVDHPVSPETYFLAVSPDNQPKLTPKIKPMPKPVFTLIGWLSSLRIELISKIIACVKKFLGWQNKSHVVDKTPEKQEEKFNLQVKEEAIQKWKDKVKEEINNEAELIEIEREVEQKIEQNVAKNAASELPLEKENREDKNNLKNLFNQPIPIYQEFIKKVFSCWIKSKSKPPQLLFGNYNCETYHQIEKFKTDSLNLLKINDPKTQEIAINRAIYEAIVNVYVQRFLKLYPEMNEESFLSSLQMTALIIAIKKSLDEDIWNEDFSPCLPPSLTLNIVNKMEREFLRVIDWNLSINELLVPSA